MRCRRLLVIFPLLSAATCAKVTDVAGQASVAPGVLRFAAYDASLGTGPMVNRALCFLPIGT